jgi:hypothetical protein
VNKVKLVKNILINDVDSSVDDIDDDTSPISSTELSTSLIRIFFDNQNKHLKKKNHKSQNVVVGFHGVEKSHNHKNKKLKIKIYKLIYKKRSKWLLKM